jgi:hypothetical protein
MPSSKNIGDFGVEHDDFVELTFGYFGETLRVHPDAGELSYLDFMAKAMEVNEEDETEGIKVTMDFLKQQIHPLDWDRFWSLALSNRQKLADLMLLSKAVVEATTGFPTTQPSDSVPTPPPTATKSKVVSSRQVKRRAIGSAKPIDSVSNVDLAMQQLSGRADLQRAVQLAQGAELQERSVSISYAHSCM